MSRKRNCLGNTIIEIFFGVLKIELFYKKKHKLIDHLKKEIRHYINFYNNDQIKFKQKPPDTISSSLLSKLIINLSKLLGSVYATNRLLLLWKIRKAHNLRR
jgi:transposase InsO family protein